MTSDGGTAATLLARCTFPPAGTAVTCAVSGGADSTALLVLAVESGLEVTAVHVDHGLRDGSSAEAEVVRANAETARMITSADGRNTGTGGFPQREMVKARNAPRSHRAASARRPAIE